MLVIPAIDILEGRVVRLRRGDYGSAEIMDREPMMVAERFVKAGAKRLHIVDLDGARKGEPVNESLIASMVASLDIPVQVGGGIRTLGSAERYFRAGARYVVLGTRACEDLFWLREICEAYPFRIILALDAQEGVIALQGWERKGSMTVDQILQEIEGIPLNAILFTDIHRDGMLMGPNVFATQRYAKMTSIPIIASGGVSRMTDLIALSGIEPDGVMGVIVGRALYQGTIPLSVLSKGGEIAREAHHPMP